MKIKPIPMKPITFILTIFTFLLSLPILFSVIWLLYIGHCDCEDLLHLPKLQAGIVVGLIFLFFVSNVVVFYLRSRLPIPGLLIVMLLLIVLLTVGLGLAGAYKMDSTPGSPLWIKTRVINKNRWGAIKSCLYKTRICDDLAAGSFAYNYHDFRSSKQSPIEGGCCKPPTSCEMVYVNGTYWKKGDANSKINNDSGCDCDCDLWENDETILCYNCRTCKQGFTKTLQRKWSKLGVFLVVLTLFLIVAHLSLFFISLYERYEEE
ncbi:hypothetical protein LguiB_024330 [Lonicera macranthoides]